ncbi:MAG: hypothetical protein LBD20_10490 [Spirochaetaceae bacterium]|jgi:hypothetical protein|nr:hypothetical protein [Spirochaetaceae bacterium]
MRGKFWQGGSSVCSWLDFNVADHRGSGVLTHDRANHLWYSDKMNLEATAQKQALREENARKARETAEKEFPSEKWIFVEDGIYLSPARLIGENSGYKAELNDARILRDLGSTVYLVPEDSTLQNKKQYDAIVNGEKMEFKNIGGNENTLATHFLKSRSQSPNVFLNLETSKLTRKQIMSTLFGARKSVTHIDKKGSIIKGYDDSNAFSGGKIILKIKGHEHLVYLSVDDLMAEGK